MRWREIGTGKREGKRREGRGRERGQRGRKKGGGDLGKRRRLRVVNHSRPLISDVNRSRWYMGVSAFYFSIYACRMNTILTLMLIRYTILICIRWEKTKLISISLSEATVFLATRRLNPELLNG